MKNKINKSMHKENGGTLLGIVFGLIVGLGIAVVVAMMITKTPTPFTNKLGMTKPAELPTMQLADPNKPLYGSSYKEAPANRPPAEKPVANVNKETVKESAGGTVTYPDVENVPETVKFSPKPESHAVAKKTMDEKSAYFLQVGAFRAASDAENVRAKLALIGIESNMSEKSSEGDNLYRVRIGPFASMDEMNRMRSKLVENSIDVAVIKTPK